MEIEVDWSPVRVRISEMGAAACLTKKAYECQNACGLIDAVRLSIEADRNVFDFNDLGREASSLAVRQMTLLKKKGSAKVDHTAGHTGPELPASHDDANGNRSVHTGLA
jgi:hypothetical protein